MSKTIKILFFSIFIISFSLILFSCSTQLQKKNLDTVAFKGHTSTFNFPKSSAQIKTIYDSVKFINSIAFYKTYFLDTNSKITIINPAVLESTSVETNYDTKTASGTASIIYNKNHKLALLTCAHIVNFPDTLYSYHRINNQNYIETVSIKDRQENYINELVDGNKMEILISDKEQDMVILVKKTDYTTQYIALNRLFLNDDEIDIGTIIYIFGYPKGKQMITQGIVGNVEKNNYIIDSNFNRGQSGGMVFVTKSDYPNFELLGMTKSSAADFHLLLKPENNYQIKKYDLTIPYSNNIYIKNYAFINYGLTNVIPIKTINVFLHKNKKILEKNGYLLKDFFK